MSIGLGLSGGSFAENYDYARIAIDLALARGGDQVVTKEGESITYFGGKTQQVLKLSLKGRTEFVISLITIYARFPSTLAAL